MKQQVNTPDQPEAYSVQSVDRAIELLFSFDQSSPSLTLTQLAKRTKLPKATAFRLLTTLRRHGLVEYDVSAGLYSLGFGLLPLADLRRHQTDIRTKALPAMHRIRDAVNESVVLTLRVGDYRMHIELVEGFQPIRRTWEPGQRVPLYVGAASWVLLASMSDEEIEAYLRRTALHPFSETTSVDPAEIWERIRQVRAQGYGESFNERGFGGAGVGAPIRDHLGRVQAALCVSAPVSRYTEELRVACIKAITEGAEEVARLMGYRGEVNSTRKGGRTDDGSHTGDSGNRYRQGL